MSERPFMQLYVSDFIGDTLHLSTEQIGAYMLLLMAMWNAGGRLPDDETKLARVVRMSVKKWRAIGGDLLTFFERNDGAISHNRLTKELQKSERKSESRAAAGAKGGSAKALKGKDAGLANGTGSLKHLPEPELDSKKEEPEGSSKKACRIPADFVPDLDVAVAKGLTPGEAMVEAEKFRNFWLAASGRNAVKQDWPATWRNWVINALARKGAATSTGPPRGKPNVFDAYAEIAQERGWTDEPEFLPGLDRHDQQFPAERGQPQGAVVDLRPGAFRRTGSGDP